MTYAATKCFWIEPAGHARLSLVRMTLAERTEPKCPASPRGEFGHSASADFGSCSCQIIDGVFSAPTAKFPPHSHPLWPKTCECGYEFHPSDEWIENHTALYRATEGNWVGPVREAPPGAMFDAFWYPFKGDDGLSLVVVLPNGDLWPIDQRSSNCTMPNDRKHHCWVRHGTPPNITVDKDGYTCQAGAGSIQSGDYHGFLREGVLSIG